MVEQPRCALTPRVLNVAVEATNEDPTMVEKPSCALTLKVLIVAVEATRVEVVSVDADTLFNAISLLYTGTPSEPIVKIELTVG